MTKGRFSTIGWSVGSGVGESFLASSRFRGSGVGEGSLASFRFRGSGLGESFLASFRFRDNRRVDLRSELPELCFDTIT